MKKEFDSVKKRKKKDESLKKSEERRKTVDFRQNEVTGEIEHLDQFGNKIRNPIELRRKPPVTIDADVIRETLKLTLAGKSIPKIAENLGVKETSLLSALAKNEDFKRDFEKAREMCSYLYEDKLEILADNVESAADVPAANFKYKVYNRLAEIKNPKKYSQKSLPASGGTNDGKPIQITINTGIDRTKKIKDIPLVQKNERKNK